MAEIIWTNKAKARLLEIFDFIAIDSEYYARKHVENIYKATERLINYPESGLQLQGYSPFTVRRLIFKNYKIVYTYSEDKIYILTVVHQAQILYLTIEEIIKEIK